MNLKLLFFLFSLQQRLQSTFAIPYNAIPDRNVRYPSGSNFFQKKLLKIQVRNEKNACSKRHLGANIPDYLRNLKEIVINEKLSKRQKSQS